MVALLLERGAAVNSRSVNGLTALHLAAQDDRVPAAKILVRHGADTDPQTLVRSRVSSVSLSTADQSLLISLLLVASSVSRTAPGIFV